MDAVPHRLSRWWRGLDDQERRRSTFVACCVALYLAHYLVFCIPQPFFIEDAGISFAYARNLVEGEGLVTWRGGERVEGFSNPLWTWLMVPFYLVGVSPFTTAKVLGATFGAFALPMVYQLTVQAMGKRSHAALLPPTLLAASTTAAIWNASGLENALFSILLATGMWRTFEDAKKPNGVPWSALCFLGLALTRPEGILYAAMGGLMRLIVAVRDRQVLRPILSWLAVFWLPFGLYFAWRYNYFGWLFPNTYYAKLDGEDRFQPWKWDTRGWKYARNYFSAFGFSYVMPLFAVGLVTLRDRRRWIAVALTAVGATLWAWNGRSHIPPAFDPAWLNWIQREWEHARVIFACLTVPILGIATLGHKGGLARLQALMMMAVGIFFVVYSGNDWMAQWRFFSYILVPLMMLLGIGLAELLAALPWQEVRLGRLRLGTLTLVGMLLWIMAPNIWNSSFSAPSPETSVSDVYKRVRYMSWVQRRLHLERVTLFDVDMGAHMFYTNWRILDIAGLVDVSMARHNYQKAFIREYIFEEGRPDFAHVHGGWATKVKVTSHPEWKRDYIEIPGYVQGGRTLHIGNHVRKDIFVKAAYEGPANRERRFAGGVTLEGVEVPSPDVPQGGELYLEYWLYAPFRKDGFRLYVLLDDHAGHQHMAALPPGYDWYLPDSWQEDEHVIGRYDFQLPDSLPEGRYDLGFVLMDTKSGQVLEPLSQPQSGEEPRIIRGEVWFPEMVKIVSREQAHDEAASDLSRAKELSKAGECEAAWQAWRDARHHVEQDTAWHEAHAQEAEQAVALCYVGRAQSAKDRAEKVRALSEARRLDHHLDAVVEPCEAAAKELDEAGDLAWAGGDAEAAYFAWRDALALDPTLSFTRRKAEEARDERLGIHGKEKDGTKSSKAKDEDDDEPGGEGVEPGVGKDDDDEDEVKPVKRPAPKTDAAPIPHPGGPRPPPLKVPPPKNAPPIPDK